jgi:hypothetical protein
MIVEAVTAQPVADDWGGEVGPSDPEADFSIGSNPPHAMQ